MNRFSFRSLYVRSLSIAKKRRAKRTSPNNSLSSSVWLASLTAIGVLVTAAVTIYTTIMINDTQKEISNEDRKARNGEYNIGLLLSKMRENEEERRISAEKVDKSLPVKIRNANQSVLLSPQTPYHPVISPKYQTKFVDGSYHYSSSVAPKTEMVSRIAFTTSQTSQTEKLGKVLIPKDIEQLYIFLQSKSEKNSDGCRHFRIQPNEFSTRLEEFLSITRDNTDLDIVITAKSRSKGWGAVQDIYISGFKMQNDFDYYCDNQIRSGVRLIPELRRSIAEMNRALAMNDF